MSRGKLFYLRETITKHSKHRRGAFRNVMTSLAAGWALIWAEQHTRTTKHIKHTNPVAQRAERRRGKQGKRGERNSVALWDYCILLYHMDEE